MANPLNVDQSSLLCISSGVQLDDSIADVLLGAERLGENKFFEFCETNLFSESPDLFAKITQNKLRTFSSKQLIAKNSKGQEIVTKSSRNLFAKLLVLSRTREINLKEFFSYSLSDYPLSLATVSGSLVKTSKVKMFEILEPFAGDLVVDVENLGDGNALVVDAMAVLQVITGKWRTFGEFADSTFAYLVKLTEHWKATKLDFVADRYPELSIKNIERCAYIQQRSKRTQAVEKIHEFWEEQRVVDGVFMQPLEFLSVVEAQ